MTQAQQQIFRYQRFHIDKSQLLGHGSYGAVYKAKCDQLPCAAKVLHQTILDQLDPGASTIMNRFTQECAFLESIRHPNIVQYLAVTVDPESRLPVLLMELLDESLTKMLERSQHSLAYYVQVDICYDIALAVAYLHSNDIIHRDLSSNNVLIIAGRRAKVTDFGMSKLAGAAPSMTPLTMCPGTLAYMLPESLREPLSYTKKLDCFSEGVIMIQVCTRLWPEPGPRTKLVPDSRSPTGSTEMSVLETDRRKNHIDLIEPTHALLPIAINCFKYQERERPSSEELCQRLAGLKDSNHYKDDVIRAKDSQIASLGQQLLEKNRQLQDYARHLQNKDWELQQHQVEIASGERQLRQLKQQLVLEEQKQATAEIQQINHSLRRQVEQLQQQLSQLSQLIQINPDHNPLSHLTWRDGGSASFKMISGAALVNGNVAYFMHCHGELCSYDSTAQKWSELPQYPYKFSSLAVINGQLTGIGGCEDVFNKHTFTDKLLSLRAARFYRSWSDVFPPMPTKRRGTTAMISKEHLIVAGGATGRSFADNLKVVEVMNTDTLVWSTVASLPHPYGRASSIIFANHLYMLGGLDDKGMTKSVLTCSLTELLQSSSSSSSVWRRVADAPAYYSTCAGVNGELLAVGGCDENSKATSAVHKYNPTTNSWNLINNMPTARYYNLVAVLPINEMMVVGGRISLGVATDSVEFSSPFNASTQ